MAIKQDEKDSVIVLSFSEELLNEAYVDPLKVKLSELSQVENGKTLIDFSGVQHLDASIVGVMIEALNLFKNNGAALKLVNISELDSSHTATTLASVFEVSNFLKDGIESF